MSAGNEKHLAMRDRFLERRVADLLRHDDRLARAEVAVRFDGGVAHVDGRVPDEGLRALVRETVCSLRGVHALWDGIVVGDAGPLRVLDIGCGPTKQRAGAVGVDRFPAPGVDVRADLGAGPGRRLPFANASVDRVYAVHVLEHILDLMALMNELHRVVADGGVLHVLSPDWRSLAAVADPTHVKYLDVQTFKWFCTSSPGALPWFPLHAGYDGVSVFADLTPVRAGEPLAPVEQLAQFFD